MVTMTCQQKKQRLEINNIHVFSKECKIKIHNIFHYTPTIFHIVSSNVSNAKYNFNVNVEKFELPKENIQLNLMSYFNNDVLVFYKTKVMPWITIFVVPLFVVSIIIIVCIARVMVFKKINDLNERIQQQLNVQGN